MLSDNSFLAPTRLRRFLCDGFSPCGAEGLRAALPANLTRYPSYLALFFSRQLLCAGLAPKSAKCYSGWILSGHRINLTCR